MDCIERCRTAALGGTVYQCTDCGHMHAVWKSCGNRHCPVLPGCRCAQVDGETGGLRPAGSYFHIVFTLPRPLARIAMQNRKTVFDIMFRTAAETLKTISADPRRFGARIGGTAVLHTWNQKMEWHPHLHCLVPNGGFDTATGQWKVGSDSFFAPVKVLASFFRRRVLEELAKAHARQELEFTAQSLTSPVPAPSPRAEAGPKGQLERSCPTSVQRTRRGDPIPLAIHPSHRNLRCPDPVPDDDTVTFRCRKPTAKTGDRPTYGTMTLSVDQFIRRFLMHRIPTGFHRIRHFGILANSNRPGPSRPSRKPTTAKPDRQSVTKPEPEIQSARKPGLSELRQTLQARPDHGTPPHRQGGGPGNGDHPEARASPSLRDDMKTDSIQRPRDRHGPARARFAKPTRTARNVAVSGPVTSAGDGPDTLFGTSSPRRSPPPNGINRPG